MGTYYIPRDTKGEGRILYIFSTKALLYTAAGAGIGALFRWICNLFGKGIPSIKGVMSITGWVILILFALIGYAIGTFKVPSLDKFELTRKAAGINIDTVIKEYIKFFFKKGKIYTYDTTDLIIEQLEKEEAQKEKEQKEKKGV